MQILTWLFLHFDEFQLVISIFDVVLSLFELMLNIGYLPILI